ncbi:MAG: hypothetical protein JSS53_09530, partial [Proteobacteria bacterium]|nr:hypothetical protein [Pseudomonadota bacterium]
MKTPIKFTKFVFIIFTIICLFSFRITEAKPAALNKQANTSQVNTLLNEFYNIKTKNPKQAETILQKILSIDPKNRNVQLEMGYLLLSQKREAESLIYFQKASALDPNDFQTIMQIAYSLNSLGRNKEAYYEFKKATKSPDKKI